ncbi:hypothetical protein ACIQMP_30950 [Streptomyces sp. NPDC091385]|uniref:hypothetical protein n=1 Tax=Streptomyces sp. NPDC091385 TaxID=3365997 RepID=UPI003821A0DF
MLRTGHDGKPVFLLVLRGALAVFMLSAPWLTAFGGWRRAKREGTVRVTVAETGVTLAADGRVRSFSWATKPRCRETRRAFLLTGGARPAPPLPPLTIIPKRVPGADSDTARLRALLERHAGLG